MTIASPPVSLPGLTLRMVFNPTSRLPGYGRLDLDVSFRRAGDGALHLTGARLRNGTPNPIFRTKEWSYVPGSNATFAPIADALAGAMVHVERGLLASPSQKPWEDPRAGSADGEFALIVNEDAPEASRFFSGAFRAEPRAYVGATATLLSKFAHQMRSRLPHATVSP